jgi:hypothetical protein
MFESQLLAYEKDKKGLFFILAFQHPIPRGNELHLQQPIRFEANYPWLRKNSH